MDRPNFLIASLPCFLSTISGPVFLVPHLSFGLTSSSSSCVLFNCYISFHAVSYSNAIDCTAFIHIFYRMLLDYLDPQLNFLCFLCYVLFLFVIASYCHLLCYIMLFTRLHYSFSCAFPLYYWWLCRCPVFLNPCLSLCCSCLLLRLSLLDISLSIELSIVYRYLLLHSCLAC